MSRFPLVLTVLALAACERDALPEGEGSYAAAEAMLDEIGKAAVGTVPPGYLRLDMDDGTWIAVRGIDTHEEADGGTVGVVTSTGEATVFFTHVCGGGPNSLISIFRTASTAAALESARGISQEYTR